MRKKDKDNPHGLIELLGEKPGRLNKWRTGITITIIQLCAEIKYIRWLIAGLIGIQLLILGLLAKLLFLG